MRKNKRRSTFAKEKIPISELVLKLSITFFCCVLFFSPFFIFGGTKYFYNTIFVDAFINNDFQIHVIDVENGDAILLKLPDSKTMLIDCGEEKYEERVVSYISQYMQAEGLNKIDYFVLTHSDSDHVGNAKAIFERFKVENLYRPKKYCLDEDKYSSLNYSYEIDEGYAYNDAITAAYQEGCNILFNEEGITLDFGGANITFLSPKESSYAEDNNYSAVLHLKYFSKTFLFMGDAEKEIEMQLIQRYGNFLDVDVLKVGHHGSKSSTCEEFLNVVKPEYAILSCSDNSNILPNGEIVARLENNGCEILSTGRLGNFALTVNQNNIYYKNASLPFNFWAIIFALLIVCLIIIWKSSFLKKESKAKSSKR